MERKVQDRIPDHCEHMDTRHHCIYTLFRRQRHGIGNRPFGYGLSEVPLRDPRIEEDREGSQSGGHPQLRSQELSVS